MLPAIFSVVVGCWSGGTTAFITVTLYDWLRLRRNGHPARILGCARSNLFFLGVPVVLSAMLAVAAVVGGWK